MHIWYLEGQSSNNLHVLNNWHKEISDLFIFDIFIKKRFHQSCNRKIKLWFADRFSMTILDILKFADFICHRYSSLFLSKYIELELILKMSE